MHELSIATAIVDKILEFAEADPARRILGVRLLVGELTCIAAEQLKFCYAAVTSETQAEGSQLDIETVEAEVSCSHCSYRGQPRYWDDALAGVRVPTLQCPVCGQTVEVERGQECTIKTVRYAQ